MFRVSSLAAGVPSTSSGNAFDKLPSTSSGNGPAQDLKADLLEVFDPFVTEFEDLGEVRAEFHIGAGDGDMVEWPDVEAGIKGHEIERLE